MLITSNFSFSHSVFWELSAIFIKFEIVICKLIQFGIILNVSFGRGLTVPQMTNFRLFQTQTIGNDHFKLDENGRKFFKQIENNVGKGEIAHNEQFLLFQLCFLKTWIADM